MLFLFNVLKCLHCFRFWKFIRNSFWNAAFQGGCIHVYVSLSMLVCDVFFVYFPFPYFLTACHCCFWGLFARYLQIFQCEILTIFVFVNFLKIKYVLAVKMLMNILFFDLFKDFSERVLCWVLKEVGNIIWLFEK